MKNESNKVASADKSVAPQVSNERVLIPLSELQQLKIDIQEAIVELDAFLPSVAMSDAERQRLLGSGVRRYGFIDKVSDFASANPGFIPPFMDVNTLKDLIRQIELLRDISIYLQQLLRTTRDNLLLTGDEAFRLALMYYNTVRDASRRRVPDAEVIFKALQLFFRRSRRPGDEPTETGVERDLRAVLQGRKDGKILVESERPVTTGGKRVLVDETHRNREGVKVSEQAEAES